MDTITRAAIGTRDPARLRTHPVSIRPGDTASHDVGEFRPRSRRLGDELPDLFALWPRDLGRISRVQYSPPDWEDHPHSVPVGERRIKTGCFPEDDTHRLTLTMTDRRSLVVTVLAQPPSPDAPSSPAGRPPSPDTVSRGVTRWENEGGRSPDAR